MSGWRDCVKHAFDIPRIVIAGASSNVGKTTITAGLIAALRQQGLIVQPFKCGPDYVDPSYHERAAGRPCRNLDTWMLSDTQLLESFARACQDADIAVVEGVMGLYDGSDWHDERGSTAQIAKLLNAPVLLVFDISGSARSAAAAVLGYKHFDPAVAIRGVVLNFAGSERHAQGCAEAIERTTTLPMMGWLPREMQLQIPERHLGLVPGGEQIDSDALIAQMAVAVSARFDVDGIVGVARHAAGTDRTAEPPVGLTGVGTGERTAELALGSAAAGAREGIGALSAGSDLGTGANDANISRGDARHIPDARRGAARPVIAVARDEAFCFYYPENLELLIEAGAAVEFFSPLRGERPGPGAAGVYLGGGYPELHGPALASNMGLWGALKDMHAADLPIYAECGGFMVLTTGLTDSDGHAWPMGGLLPGFARMSGKLAALGYRHATALRSNLLAEPGEALRGHEFRYSSWVRDIDVADDTAAWQVKGTRGEVPNDAVGYARGNLLASYLHVHFGQRRELAERFVQRLERAG
jgi:cobyrinic acid a,c-diamide synthase